MHGTRDFYQLILFLIINESTYENRSKLKVIAI